jgi:hypothetical protein
MIAIPATGCHVDFVTWFTSMSTIEEVPVEPTFVNRADLVLVRNPECAV